MEPPAPPCSRLCRIQSATAAAELRTHLRTASVCRRCHGRGRGQVRGDAYVSRARRAGGARPRVHHQSVWPWAAAGIACQWSLEGACATLSNCSLPAAAPRLAPLTCSVTDGDGGEQVRGDAYVYGARREVRECIIRVFGRGLQLESLANGA
jgi:hypothetical protein